MGEVVGDVWVEYRLHHEVGAGILGVYLSGLPSWCAVLPSTGHCYRTVLPSSVVY